MVVTVLDTVAMSYTVVVVTPPSGLIVVVVVVEVILVTVEMGAGAVTTDVFVPATVLVEVLVIRTAPLQTTEVG